MANVLNSTQMTNYRRNTVGMPGTKKIPLMVSEDLLPCLTDAEVATAIAQMRNNATEVIHVITCAVPSDTDPLEAKTGDLVSRSADFNWKTHAEWKRLVGTELVMNAEDGSVL